MKNLTALRNVLSCLVVLALPNAASAGIFRAYLASTGNDASPCTLPQPCRLMPAALAAVNDGGEIWIMDSANFNTGTVNINKSVSILAIPGALGSVVANGGDAISIDAPSSTVKLRSLSIRPLSGFGFTGIAVANVGSLFIEGVTMESLSNGLTLTGAAVIKMKDSVLRSNSYGINITQAGGAEEIVSIDNTSFFENQISMNATTGSTTGFIRITIDNSVVNGIGAFANGGMSFGGGVVAAAPVKVSIVRTKIAGRGASNGYGISAFGSQTIVTLGDCHISGYAQGVSVLNGVSGLGVLRTFGNNMFDDVPGNSPMTAVATQ